MGIQMHLVSHVQPPCFETSHRNYLALKIDDFRALAFKPSLNRQQSPEHSVGEAEDSHTFLLSEFPLGSITSNLDTQSTLNAREPLMNEIVNFFSEISITDNETIIRTCIMDDTTLLGVTARTDSTYLGLAQKVFRGQECIEEEDRTPEDAPLLSRYKRLRDRIEGG
jgi:hypothetical protein